MFRYAGQDGLVCFYQLLSRGFEIADVISLNGFFEGIILLTIFSPGTFVFGGMFFFNFPDVV